jgi:prepilin-type N-terminal cleavage/methylation domain-containing protein
MSAQGQRLRGEDGVTLVELLTAITVSAVVMAFVTGAVVDALRSQRRQTAQVAALNDAKLAFERVTRDVRGADPLQVAALDRITLDVRQPDATVRTVTYARAGDSLVRTDTATGQTRTLVAQMAAGQPLFLFHLADGSTATGAAAVAPRSVQSITVRLQVEPRGAGRVVDLTNRVVVRNVVL